MFFDNVPAGPPDPVYILKSAVDSDTSSSKVDLGVGVYRNERGEYNELRAIVESKKLLAQENPGHDYEVTTGSASFVAHAAALLFGRKSEVLKEAKVTSVQAISGTGAIHLGALFLSRCKTFAGKKVYIGTPAWGNYEPLFNLVGLEVVKYKYYDAARGVVDFPSILNAVETAEEGSIFVLQACCHNPSGADLTSSQWRELATHMKTKQLFPFFDVAYQGLGGSLDEDAYGLRYFAQAGFEMLAAQSFSKNFGLYGERVGVLHAVSGTQAVAANVWDQLRCLVRWEFSSSPAYGARLVDGILGREEVTGVWADELATMRERLVALRQALHHELVEKHRTPGNWSTILSSTGLFCFLDLNPQQVSTLATKYHIYMLPSGRINVSGMNASNIKYLASSINEVVQASGLISAHL